MHATSPSRTTTTLTDRYVDAAMRTVPESGRDDLAAELRASIDDQIDARVDDGEPRDVAERAVLTGLGDPEKLAADYTGRTLYLIGPRYYLDWWRLLKLLLWIVLPTAALGVALARTLTGSNVGEVIGGTVVTLLTVALHVVFWTTLIFVIVERGWSRGARAPLTEWTVDQLPEPRPRGVGFGDMVASLVFLAIAVGAVIWDRFVGFVPTQPGLSFLNPELWPWWIGGLFVLMALEAVLAVVVYLVRGWTWTLAIVNAAIALAVAVPALLLLAQGMLVNPDFFPAVARGAAESDSNVAAILSVVFGFVIAGIAVWDITDVFVKTSRTR
ncbi:permease prefix domain 1-containing protein [Microbacterium sp. HD4P20]|uniref:permease prefix domain 1-containing protein n=1 Tax=Microbacterium sp. HD4P20 TaxID=2864874 RepID=UPI001C63DC04|nr:permease prefix domain 1-containing protein [Microbacterium sp. HD4P20]MCP2636246.1 permease prefix domain 1-containing protein [Microbacterium sp. HD4P20]